MYSLVTGPPYFVSIFNAAEDPALLLSSNSISALAGCYIGETGSSDATVSLLVVPIIPATLGTVGTYLNVDRQF